MNLKQMRYFVHVADLRSFTKAATVLNVSQPALSRQLTNLEEELGTKLLQRHSHGVSLTFEGSRFLERCAAIIKHHERLVRDFTEKQNDSLTSGSVGLGMPVSLTKTFAPFVQRIHAQFPGIKLRIVEGYSALLHEWVVMGSIDFACLFGPRPSKVVDAIPLAIEDLFVVASSKTGYRNCQEVSIEQVNQRTLILPDAPHFLRTLANHIGISGKDFVTVDAFSLMIELTKTNVGVTILPMSAIASEIASGHMVALRLPNASPTWEVSLSYSNLKPLTKAAIVIRTALQDEVQRLIKSGEWKAKSLVQS